MKLKLAISALSGSILTTIVFILFVLPNQSMHDRSLGYDDGSTDVRIEVASKIEEAMKGESFNCQWLQLLYEIDVTQVWIVKCGGSKSVRVW